MIYSYKDKHPKIHETCFIAQSADIIGDVEIGADSSVWFSATIRADQNSVRIGKNVSIQDNVVLHVDFNHPILISDDVAIGHGAVLHACRIGSSSVIGMGAIVLSGAEIGRHCIIAAGSVITEDTKIPDNSIVMGVPGRIVKQATEEHLKRIKKTVEVYTGHVRDYKKYVAGNGLSVPHCLDKV